MAKRGLGRLAALTVGLVVTYVLTAGLTAEAQTPKKVDPKKTTPTPDPKKAGTPTKVKEESRPAEAPPAEPIVTLQQVTEMNKHIEKAWADNKLKASRMCSDYEYIRRASLDIIGRIATPPEIDQFMKDPPQSRRAALIDRLLESEDYADNWANIWTTWLMTRSGPKKYHEEMQIWLGEQFAKGASWDKIVTGLLTATGENNDNGAVNFILSHLGEPTPQPKIQEEGPFQYVPITARTTRLFLGTQTQCTQCHDHPFNPAWKQKHFWGTNAFFRQIQRDGQPMMQGNQRGMPAPKLGLRDNDNFNAQNMVNYETRKAVVLATRAVFLDGRKFDPKKMIESTDADGKKIKREATRREQLAEFVVTSETFSKAYVNRIWAHFLGRSMTVNAKDFDDFGEHNAETHPEMLAFMAEEFKKAKFDPKQVVRWICNSKPYHLSSTANETNDKPDAEPFYSRMLLKAMSPEQLFSSIWISTYDNPFAKVKKSKGDKDKLRDAWMNRLIVNFGDDEGNETNFNGTVVQALMLMNGIEINDAISDKDGPVEAAIGRAMRSRGTGAVHVMDELFLATLNRRPHGKEIGQLLNDMKPVLVKEKNPSAPYQDLFWALLNSSEFILNH